MNDDRTTIRDIARDAASFLSISAFVICVALACVAMKPVVLPV